ncbi:MAG: ArnT family glycosyltransferase [Leptolyngbyaceae cyanobacterium]
MHLPVLPIRFRLSTLMLLAGAAVLLLLRSPEQSLMAHDEGYYAQQARWILETGDWLTVPWWEPIYDRTIGLQWLIASSYALFGVREGTARLPSTLASLGAIWLIYQIGRHCIGDRRAWWGAAILAVTPVWVQASRLATQDIPLVCVELFGLWALLQVEDHPKHRWQWGIAAGSSVGLAFLIKGFMAVLPVVAIMPYLVFTQRQQRHLTNPGLYGGLLLGCLPPGLWLGLSVNQYGWLPLEQLFGKLLHLSGEYVYATTPLYYLWNIPANGFPWPLFALAGLVLAFKQRTISRPWLFLGYPLILLLELAYFDTRTWYYPLQIYPFLALWAAVALVHLAKLYGQRDKSHRHLPLGLSYGLMGLALLLLIAGAVVVTMPEKLGDATLRPYGLLGLAGGVGWLLPGCISWRDRRSWPPRPELWLTGWLLGPGLILATLGLTGLWGNYAADLKAALQAPAVEQVLHNEPVYFVFTGSGTAEKTPILLTYYTPHPGERLDDLTHIPSRGYAWVDPKVELPLPAGYTQIGAARDWRLVQAP